MANTRLMLWVALAAILYLNYEAWMRDYREPAAAECRQPRRRRRGARAKPARRLGAQSRARRLRSRASAAAARSDGAAPARA